MRSAQIRVPGGARLDLTLALESGPMASGLLGKTSLTYQVGAYSIQGWFAALDCVVACKQGAPWRHMVYCTHHYLLATDSQRCT